MKELLASVVMAAAVAGGGDVPPAPTLIWVDPPPSEEAYVRGLTRSGTAVTVKVNGASVSNLRYGASRGGVGSFAAPLPADLQPGVYVVSATASRAGIVSTASSPIYLVVPGFRLAPPRLA